MMMSDGSVAVHKRVIQSMTHLYKVALSWLSKAKVITDDMEAVWNVICSLKEIITGLLEAANDGIRTHTVKFMEMLVLTQTHAQSGPAAAAANQFSLNDVPLTLKVSRLFATAAKKILLRLTFFCISFNFRRSRADGNWKRKPGCYLTTSSSTTAPTTSAPPT